MPHQEDPPARKGEGEELPVKLTAGVILFGVIIIFTSAVITKRRDKMEASEIATYIVLVAWGSLLWGFFLSRYAR
jgi:hypothetical protein